jgi:WD40 repeat protein
MLGTILSIAGIVSDAFSAYKFGSTLVKGVETKPVLGALERIDAHLERLSDNILYAPGIEGLRDTTGAARRPIDLRDVRASLEPVQAALGEEIVSSELITTPDKMERAMIANPWAVLEDIRPQHFAIRPSNPDKVPVLFEHNGVRYIGWQMRGALPQLFNCELQDLPGLGTSLTPERPSIKPSPPPMVGSGPLTPPPLPKPAAEDRIEAPHIRRDIPNTEMGIARQQNIDPLVHTFTEHSGMVHAAAFSPDGRSILSGSWDNTLKLWDVATNRELLTFVEHTNWVHSIAFSPDGRTALSGSADKTLKLWDVRTSRILHTFTGHTAPILSVAFSPDGRTVLSASQDKKLKLWEVGTGKLLRTFTGHSEMVASVTYAPDGRAALSSSADKTLKLWDVGTGKVLRTLKGHTDLVFSAVFSKDGRTALSGSADKTLKLWDVVTERVLHTFRGHSGNVTSVAISPDGCTALSGGKDRTLALWDVTTGQELHIFTGHTGSVYSVAFSPDGRTALSGSKDETLKLWDLTPYLPRR